MKKLVGLGLMIGLFFFSVDGAIASQKFQSEENPTLTLTCESSDLHRKKQKSRGFSVDLELNKNTSSHALVYKIRYTSRGSRISRKITVLPCFYIENEIPTTPDRSEIVLECFQKEIVDAGYKITYSSADLSGRSWVTLYEQSFIGSKELEKMPCWK